MTDHPADSDPRDAEPALMRWAKDLTKDPAEAQALVAQTLQTAGSDVRQGPAAPENQAELFRTLRRSYHSVERTRSRRPVRDAVITAMAQAGPITPLS
jgi:hypothetical protein